MQIDISLFGDQQVSRDLLRFTDRIDDASPAFQQIADDLRAIEQRQFSSHGDYGSGGWPPLSPVTIARKQHSTNPTVAGNAHRILVATERLMRSLTGRDGDHIEIVQPHQLVFGTTVPYARFHQLGEGVPRRRPLELPETARRDVVRTLQNYLVQT